MPERVAVSLRIPGTSSAIEIAQLVQKTEAAGFDGVGILDSQLLVRDVFVTMAISAMQTSRINIFSAVTNPFSRDASVLASAMQSVEELAPGRVQCIIGTGYTSAMTIGRKPATLAQMRATIHTMRTLLAGKAEDFNGTSGRLGFASGRHIPILMAASGPKAIELAGEVADGVLLLVGFSPAIVEAVLATLDKGAKLSGRRLEDLEIIWAVRTGTADTTEEARRQARPPAVHWGIMGWGSHWLQQTGPELPKYEIPQAIWDIYPDLSHAVEWETAIAATNFVPDEVIAELCDALGLIGTPDHCTQRIIDMTEHGVRNLYLMPFQTFVGPEKDLEAFRDVIFPTLQSAGYR